MSTDTNGHDDNYDDTVDDDDDAKPSRIQYMLSAPVLVVAVYNLSDEAVYCERIQYKPNTRCMNNVQFIRILVLRTQTHLHTR